VTRCWADGRAAKAEELAVCTNASERHDGCQERERERERESSRATGSLQVGETVSGGGGVVSRGVGDGRCFGCAH
jgi:hypothetical protein